jgi:hypothetical protein
MKGRTVFDGRLVLNKDELTRIGFEYLSFGRSVTAAQTEQPRIDHEVSVALDGHRNGNGNGYSHPQVGPRRSQAAKITPPATIQVTQV